MKLFGGAGETWFDTECDRVVDGGGTDLALICAYMADQECRYGAFGVLRILGLLVIASSDVVREV